VTIRGTQINPVCAPSISPHYGLILTYELQGDIIFADPLEGVVCIPKSKLEQVIDLLPQLVEADDKVKEDVGKGKSVKEAFAEHRGT